MADPKILQTFPNPAPQRDYLIEHTHHEFTSLCPITGHPDFATITVRYVPDRVCVELKSLKLYFHAFRNEGIFFEAATNRICDELGALLKPRRLTIVANWKARGGFTSVITAEWKPRAARSRLLRDSGPVGRSLVERREVDLRTTEAGERPPYRKPGVALGLSAGRSLAERREVDLRTTEAGERPPYREPAPGARRLSGRRNESPALTPDSGRG